MPLTLDTSLMFRATLDEVHGLGPGTMQELEERFPAVRAEIATRTEQGEYGFHALDDQGGVVREIEEWAAQ